MIRQISLSLLIVAALSAGCQNQKSDTSTTESSTSDSSATVSPEPTNSGKLETRLGTAGKSFTKDSVLLSFTVINHTDSAQRFCKWETPFEPRLGKYLEVIHENGTEAIFKGAMARRVMPPPAETYIEVAPHDSVRTVFNLPDNYAITTGQYTVKYSGGGVSGLDAGNEIKIKISNP
ncbi:hypothetical protein QNI19_03700 [Cytophagaceae bacterium DM2B3-1]|uniref:Protease n=1 Tax=Xanthocytophaga flava TaxID=3048013 RepID=A0ABT7CER1_9BACT|nr:hypothetical protein [Xanthocytophaga flavus]MDJ1468848.1 hypothetical protein [Xanthocytophaga flavus]MDJ1492021.1 hypothetical protein [Xanthocytophaga flavus]